MKAEYDFSQGTRRAVLSSTGKTRITIYIDDDIVEEFRARAEEAGTGYQTMMNSALKNYLGEKSEEALTESTLRRVLQEEFPKLVPSSNSS